MAEVKWIPAVSRLAMFMQQTGRNTAALNQEIYKTKKKISTETFAANIQKFLAEADSETQLAERTGLAYSEALSKGLSGAVPMINQYSQLYGKKLGIEQQEDLGKAWLDTLPPEQQFWVGDDAKTVEEIKKQFGPMFPDNTEAQLAQLISKLPQVKEETRIESDEFGIHYVQGITTPSGKFISTATGLESIERTSEGIPFLEQGGDPGFTEGKDRYLSPTELGQYAVGQRRERMLQIQAERYDKDKLSPAYLSQVGKLLYFQRNDLMGAALVEETARLTVDLDPERDKDEIARITRETRLRYFGTKNATGFQSVSLDVLQQLNPTFYNANIKEISTIREKEALNDELLEANYSGKDIYKYLVFRNDFYNKLDSDNKALFNTLGSKERHKWVTSGKINLPSNFTTPPPRSRKDEAFDEFFQLK